MYELLLRRGTPEELMDWVDGALLVDLWGDLRIPQPIRGEWQPVVAAAGDGPLERPWYGPIERDVGLAPDMGESPTPVACSCVAGERGAPATASNRRLRLRSVLLSIHMFARLNIWMLRLPTLISCPAWRARCWRCWLGRPAL